jgi:eukaryotic-like serine/threonine-protein kinase
MGEITIRQPHLYLYQVGFLQHDPAQLSRQIQWAKGKPGQQSLLLYFEANSATYSGELKKSRELVRQAVASAELAGEKDRAAGAEATAALSEALFGNAEEALHRAKTAAAQSSGQDGQYCAALALAMAGESSVAEEVAEDLAKRFPEDTIVQFNYLPTIRAQVALNRNDAAKAVEVLQAATPYELGVAGSTAFSTNLYPIYVRGEPPNHITRASTRNGAPPLSMQVAGSPRANTSYSIPTMSTKTTPARDRISSRTISGWPSIFIFLS